MHDANRVLAFRRWDGEQDILVMASLNNHDFADGYRIQHPAIVDGRWQEIFNSDSGVYGGSGLLNTQASETANGSFTALLPTNSVVAFECMDLGAARHIDTLSSSTFVKNAGPQCCGVLRFGIAVGDFCLYCRYASPRT